MKRLFTLLSICSSLFSLAQPCTPDSTLKQTGIYPSTLPPAEAEKPYSQIVQFRLPTDTVAMYQGNPVNVKVDSVEIVEVLNMPPGLTYQCNPANCIMPTSRTNCATLSGIISTGNEGHYQFEIVILIHGRVFGSFPVTQEDTIRSLSMDVNAVGMEEADETGINAFPNPSSGEFFILTDEALVDGIYDLSGRKLDLPVTYEPNRVRIDSSILEDGIYLVTLSVGDRQISLRMLKGTGTH